MRIHIIIPASKRDACNNWMKTHVDKIGGDKTFRIGLSATGNAPATHYWTCFGFLSKTVLKNIKANLGFSNLKELKQKIEAKTGGRVYKDQTNEAVLSAEGLKVIQSEA